MSHEVFVCDVQGRPVRLTRDQVKKLKPYINVKPVSNVNPVSRVDLPPFCLRSTSPSFSYCGSHTGSASDSGSEPETDSERGVSQSTVLPVQASFEPNSQLNSKKKLATKVFKESLRFLGETTIVLKDGGEKPVLVNKPICVRGNRTVRIRAKKAPILKNMPTYLKAVIPFVEEVSVNATGADKKGMVNGVLLHLRCKVGHYETVWELYRSIMTKAGFNVEKKEDCERKRSLYVTRE
jgi:hypothetical protein